MATYTVQSGDTLGGIAAKLLGSASKYMAIAELNGLENPNAIAVGQVLKIPEQTAPPQPEAPSGPVVGGGPAVVLTAPLLKEIMPKATDANIDKYLDPLNTELAKFQINTPMRQAQFIAQVAHESGYFRYNVENLNYSAKALRAVFGRYFPSDEAAAACARQPEKIANVVYANRMGNGDTASGDGWSFRGRGLIQLTGKDNYTKCGEGMGVDFISNPHLLQEPEGAVGGACWYWDSRNLNKYADQDDVKKITKLINGGYNGLKDREAILKKAKRALRVG